MIYFTLRGGLGNMLFQIATVNSVALSKNTEASFGSLDGQLSYLDSEKTFNPSLTHSQEYRKLNMFKNMLNKTSPKGVKVYSSPFHYEEINIDGDEAILDGFYQSEKYFKNHEKEIKELFKPTDEILNHINDKYGSLLKDGVSSLHVRRGDYVKNSNNHPPCSLEYYNEAISCIGGGKILIFSDDIPWCMETFTGNDFIFIENELDYIELYLMSMCKNNIISNSSFSWWGAWLNNNENKIVVGPKKWFGPNINHHIGDILPNTWIKI